MKFKWKALITALALAIPAIGWAAGNGGLRSLLPCGEDCPIPCDDCPLAKR